MTTCCHIGEKRELYDVDSAVMEIAEPVETGVVQVPHMIT